MPRRRGRSKWTKKRRVAVKDFVAAGVSRTAAEVYRMLQRRRLIGNLTIGNIRTFLNENYSLSGKKRCQVSRRLVQCWIRKPPKTSWDVGSYDGSNLHMVMSEPS